MMTMIAMMMGLFDYQSLIVRGLPATCPALDFPMIPYGTSGPISALGLPEDRPGLVNRGVPDDDDSRRITAEFRINCKRWVTRVSWCAMRTRDNSAKDRTKGGT